MNLLSHKKYWKGALLIISLFFMSRRVVLAEFSQFDQVFQVSLGGTTGANRYYDQLAAAGIDLGAAYRLYPFQNNRLSLGFEGTKTSFKDQPTSDLDRRIDVSLLSYGAFARFDLTPESDFLTYISIGALALDYTKDSHDSTGTHTTNTTRGGFLLALGFDRPMGEAWRLGVEARTIGDSAHFVEAITGRMTMSYVWSAN